MARQALQNESQQSPVELRAQLARRQPVAGSATSPSHTHTSAQGVSTPRDSGERVLPTALTLIVLPCTVVV